MIMRPGQRLIQCFGLFWKWTDVSLGGGQGNRATLLGHPQGGKRKNPIDFADQQGIYVLYADYRLIYVGQTARRAGLLGRLNDHTKDHLASRWDRFSWFGIRRVTKAGKLSVRKDHAHPTLEVVLNQIEALLIHAAEPALNRSSGKWESGVRPYFQVRDERLGPKPEEMMKYLWDMQKSPKTRLSWP